MTSLSAPAVRRVAITGRGRVPSARSDGPYATRTGPGDAHGRPPAWAADGAGPRRAADAGARRADLGARAGGRGVTAVPERS